MQVRKVVTGHDAEGRAVIARDEKIDGMPIPGLGELVFLWSADEPATYPNSGDNPAAPALFPPVGGIRFVIASYSPGIEAVAAPEAAPGIHVEEGDEPGMHTTDSTDFGVLLSGNVVLELDNGAEVSLSPGDVVVQNGTRHRWRVVGDVPAIPGCFHHRSPPPLGSGLRVRWRLQIHRIGDRLQAAHRPRLGTISYSPQIHQIICHTKIIEISQVAVGTAIARRPPHRSRRAELPHRAPASGHDVEPPVGTGMPEFGAGQPTFHDPHHSPPRQPVSLASSPQAPQPVPDHVVVE
jgi:hypothetical protein